MKNRLNLAGEDAAYGKIGFKACAMQLKFKFLVSESMPCPAITDFT